MEQMLEFRLKENVPLGADEAVFDYNTIRTTESTAVLNVSVYPLALYERYAEAFHAADLSLLSAEIEGQATARALLDPEHPLPTLILDVGRNEASLSISTRGVVTFTATLESGGDLFTRAIARGLNLSFQEAERLKRKYGFRDTPDNRDVFDKLTPILSEFKEAIRKHLMYWHMHTNIGGDAVEEVATVVLVGGNANVAGLAEYLSTELDLPVEVGNVWGKTFENYDHYLPEIPAQSSLEYATAIGLARRSLLRGR
jgi:cell division ATPase FtsA